MSKKDARPLILVTGDDGLRAPGLPALIEALAPLARLRAALTEEERSGVGHAVTLRRTLKTRPVEIPGTEAAFAVDGTPADAVKLALTTIWRELSFDLAVSGINRGPNVGVNVLYSGTVAAGLEAVIAGVPALAVSLDVGEGSDYVPAAKIAAELAEKLLARAPWGRGSGARKYPPGLVNVNVPNRPEIRGRRITRQGVSGFQEYYLPAGEGNSGDGSGEWRIEGEMVLREKSLEYDAVALREGWVSITPLGLELNAREAPECADGWGFLL